MANPYNNAMAGNFASSYTQGSTATQAMKNPAIESATGLYNATPNFNNTTQAAIPGQENRTYDSNGYGSFTQQNQREVGGIDPLTGHRIESSTGMGGTWTSGQGGPQITNLPGYLGMKEQQQAGSDFSMYSSRLKDLMSDPSKITETPGYKFAVGQGTQAINRSAAARGQLGGGGVLAELAKYGQGMASQEYGNEVNRLSGLMGKAQQFGIGTGYYNPEQYTASLGIKTGGGGGGGGGGTSSSGVMAPGSTLGGMGMSPEAWSQAEQSMSDYSAQVDKERADYEADLRRRLTY